MPYDVRAKHGDLVALLSEQYKVYVKSRAAFLRTDFDRRYGMRKDRGDEGMEVAIRAIREDIAWEAANEDRIRMDEAGMKLHVAIKRTIKHYS